MTNFDTITMLTDCIFYKNSENALIMGKILPVEIEDIKFQMLI